MVGPARHQASADGFPATHGSSRVPPGCTSPIRTLATSFGDSALSDWQKHFRSHLSDGQPATSSRGVCRPHVPPVLADGHPAANSDASSVTFTNGAVSSGALSDGGECTARAGLGMQALEGAQTGLNDYLESPPGVLCVPQSLQCPNAHDRIIPVALPRRVTMNHSATAPGATCNLACRRRDLSTVGPTLNHCTKPFVNRKSNRRTRNCEALVGMAQTSSQMRP